MHLARRRHPHHHTNHHTRHFPWSIVAFVTGGLVCIIGLFWILFGMWSTQKTTSPYLAVLFYKDPVQVVLVDVPAKKTIIITIPQDVVIDAVGGYGQLSIGSLWKLGQIEKKQGMIVMQSVSRMLGIPISYYVDATHLGTPLDFQTVGALRYFLSHPVDTNISWTDRLVIWRFMRSLPLVDATTVGFDQLAVTTSVVRSDGSLVSMPDIAQLDVHLDDMVSLPTIRKERVKITVINTTDIPGVGTQMARMLTHLGMYVASVDSDIEDRTACQLSGTQDALSTYAAQAIGNLWHCTHVVMPAFDRTDLTLRIGKTYAEMMR